MTEGAGLEIRDVAGGVRIRLRVHPGARREGFGGVHEGALKVSVAAAPDRGRANEAVIALLAGLLGIPRGRVRIVQGGSSRDKLAEIAGMSVAAVRKGLGPPGYLRTFSHPPGGRESNIIRRLDRSPSEITA